MPQFDAFVNGKTDLAAPPAGGDMVPIMDVSDTSEDAGGTLKRVSVTNLLSGASGGAASTAGDVTIADAGGFYSGANVEAALQEVGPSVPVDGTWTPTVTAGSGTITTKSATGDYTLVGNVVIFDLTVTITTNGTGATSVVATMPFTASSRTSIFAGREDAVTGAMLQGKLAGGGSSVSIFTTGNAYPGGDGRTLRISGSYRKA